MIFSKYNLEDFSIATVRVNDSATADLIKTTKKGIYDVTRGEYVTERLIEFSKPLSKYVYLEGNPEQMITLTKAKEYHNLAVDNYHEDYVKYIHEIASVDRETNDEQLKVIPANYN